MSTDIPKAYEPIHVEDKWYAEWLAKGHFTADPTSTKPPYSIVIPPPNVTGVLTMGHVLNNTLQDVLARRKRMQGYEVLWLPGTDHAGIATQTVVEKNLKKQGVMKHRDDLGRDKFLEKVWGWKEKHGGIIIQQLKKLGCSCDWTRERFTMDEDYSQAVLRTFVDLYQKGYIYRGKRMVNWDPAGRTALSDEEVIMTETQGHLWHIRYSADVIVATTRPETMLGDEAVAVNPDDPRYRHLIGRKLTLPLQNKEIPVIADAAVDPKFGTGCVKVTPAHDVADYEMALRHNLPFTVVIGPDGIMTDEAGEDYEGLDRFECREAVVEQLKIAGLLVKVEEYTHNVGYSERTNVPIEPYLSEQWFLKYPQVPRSTEAVETGAIKFYPERWQKTYTHWMKNIRDWCISRQLWWGHRIPVWYRVGQASSLSTSSRTMNKLEACPTFVPFDQLGSIAIAHRHLPHWEKAGATYFVTFRLADSLPAEKLDALEMERAQWMRSHPEPWSETDRRDYYDRFAGKVEQWLDAGHGSCILAGQREAQIVADALRHFDGQRYTLGAWVVMPNHVHVLVTPLGTHTLTDILHSWKSFTANQINQLLDRSGQLWQHESFDHIVRNEASLQQITTYIEQNPALAGINVEQASSLSTSAALPAGKLEACPTVYVGLTPPPDSEYWIQDTDVLDTWFSSWLWPFATMDAATRKKFYPTTDLVTAPDIIFFWVARMIMAGYEYTDTKPFANVYFTGIIRDAQGRKMSKSLGNSPDPLDLIAKYGADGLRFGLMLIAPQGQDILFDEKRCEVGRNFMNKLWNAARFIQMQRATNPPARPHNAHDYRVLHELNSAIIKTSAALDAYRFNEAAKVLYDFVWGDFCDWYIEASKVSANVAVLDEVFRTILRLLHPYAPFITEELWNGMGYATDTIQFAPWPEPTAQAGMDIILETQTLYAIVTAGRQLRNDNGVDPKKKVQYVIKPGKHETFLRSEAVFLKQILNAESLTIDSDYTPAGLTPSVVTTAATVFMVGAVDPAAEKLRLTKQLADIEKQLAATDAKLANESFVSRAAPIAVERERERQKSLREQRDKVQTLLGAL